MSYPEPLPRSAMRASTADRDRAVDVLRAAYSEGRLTHAELESRIDSALRARTYGDLAALVIDVPTGPLPWQTVQLRPDEHSRSVAPARRLPPARTDAAEPAAVVSLVLAMSAMVLGPMASIGAIISGHVAQNRIARNGSGGAGMSVAGLLLGYIGLALTALFVLVVIFGLAVQGGPAGPGPMMR
jgi:hypothetical protein